MKRILSLALTLMLVFSMLPVSAFAQGASTEIADAGFVGKEALPVQAGELSPLPEPTDEPQAESVPEEAPGGEAPAEQIGAN